MGRDRAAEELEVLRRLMERPVRFSTMSGLSGALAAAAAMGGCAVDGYFSGHYCGRGALGAHVLIWAGVFLTALVATVVLTGLREVSRGTPPRRMR